ncbi:AAA family ATPase [Flavitalea flava]
MIKEISINNFKSVQELTIPLTRFNVLIGSNGSGKSNILEAIAFGAAASANKLDNEFLSSRGIRASDSPLMKSAFSISNASKEISLQFKTAEKDIQFSIEEDDGPVLKWVVKEKGILEGRFIEIFLDALSEMKRKDPKLYDRTIEHLINNKNFQFGEIISWPREKELTEFLGTPLSQDRTNRIHDLNFHDEFLANFIIYSPEISALRKFEDESQIKPLGIKGEGLFNLLQIFNESESYGPDTINELKRYLYIIEWFDDFEAIYDKASGRKSLVVKDRYIPEINLNQNNVNEGFLFLLFYISLFVSRETPSFFAIDNIEASFHPRVCEELIKILIKLSKDHNKQIILTTHNPFVLDGLDLEDEEQTLFVVRRNSDGETIADKIGKQKEVKLSEAWIRGYIGGQPETIE